MKPWIQTHVGQAQGFATAAVHRAAQVPYGQGSYADPYAPNYYHPVPRRRSWVGLDPGSGWTQAPTAQEQAQGYKKTDVMTLSIKVGELRAKVDALVAQADPSTDPASMALLTKLASDVATLDTDVASLLQGWQPFVSYPSCLVRFAALTATWNSFGIEQATAPAPAPKSPGAPAPAPVTTTEKHAAPGAPVIVKKASGYWGYALAGALVAVGLVLLKLGKVF